MKMIPFEHHRKDLGIKYKPYRQNMSLSQISKRLPPRDPPTNKLSREIF